MAALDFPTSPTIGQVYTDNGKSWIWDGVSWQIALRGYTGSFGYTGSRGFTGSQGFSGSRGFSGSIGFTGSRGFTGSIGFTGSRGFSGSRGFTGSIGFTGSQGFSGSRGFSGSAGIMPTGGGTDAIFYENDLTVASSYTVGNLHDNAFSAGPVTVNNGVTVTVPDGVRWVVLD